MIQIKNVRELENYPELPIIMQAQIGCLLYRPLQVVILETNEEYEEIRESVEAFAKRFSFLRHIGFTEDLKHHVIFPFHLGESDATVFYIPIAYVRHLL